MGGYPGTCLAALDSEEEGGGANGGRNAGGAQRGPQRADARVVIPLIRVLLLVARRRVLRLRRRGALTRRGRRAVIVVVTIVVALIEVADAQGAALGLDVVLALGQLDGVAGVGVAALLEGLLADVGVEGRVVVPEAGLGAVLAGAAVFEGVLRLLVSSLSSLFEGFFFEEGLELRDGRGGNDLQCRSGSPGACRDTAFHKCSAPQCTTRLSHS